MESSGGKGRLTLARGDSRFDGSKTLADVPLAGLSIADGLYQDAVAGLRHGTDWKHEQPLGIIGKQVAALKSLLPSHPHEAGRSPASPVEDRPAEGGE